MAEGVKEVKKGIKGFKDTLKMYDYFISCLIRKKILLRGNVSKGHYTLGRDFIQGSDTISVFYQIQSFSRTLPNAMVERIRDTFEGMMGEDIRINFISQLEKHIIDWSSTQMQLQLKAWREQDEQSRNKDAFSIANNFSTSETSEWLKDTITDLYMEENKNKRDILRVSFVINIVNTDISDRGIMKFETFLEELSYYLKTNGIYFERLSVDLDKFINTQLPFNADFEEDKGLVVSKSLFTDVLYSKTMELRQGRIGDSGIYLLTDIYSGKSVFKKVKETAESNETWLVTAESGGGKSYLVKMMAIMLLSQGFNGTINDIEGDEYLPLADWISTDNPDAVRVVNMRQGGYIDPFPIPNLVGDEEIDSTLKSQSVDYVTSLLKSLIGDKIFEENTWADSILDAAVGKLYSVYGVTNEPNTWKNSQRGSIKDILGVFDSALETGKPFDGLSKHMDKDEFTSVATLMYVKLSTYFSEKGLRSGFFRYAIAISELNEADLVIVSFNMKNTPESSIDPVQMKIMQLSASILSYQRSIYSKYVLGKFNFKIWEEYQRWGDFSGSDKILSTNVTGGRKLGDVVIIVTNSIGSILYSDRSDHKKVFENVRSFMIGAIGDSGVRADLLKRLSISHLKPELDKIAISTVLNNKTSITGDAYKYAFLACLDRKDFSVGKVCLPPELEKSSLFRTGVMVKE